MGSGERSDRSSDDVVVGTSADVNVVANSDESPSRRAETSAASNNEGTGSKADRGSSSSSSSSVCSCTSTSKEQAAFSAPPVDRESVPMCQSLRCVDPMTRSGPIKWNITLTVGCSQEERRNNLGILEFSILLFSGRQREFEAWGLWRRIRIAGLETYMD